MQLDRYVSVLLETENRYSIVGEKFTTVILKKTFDLEFKELLNQRFFSITMIYFMKKKEAGSGPAATVKRTLRQW
jgi:hypothetical protein